MRARKLCYECVILTKTGIYLINFLRVMFHDNLFAHYQALGVDEKTDKQRETDRQTDKRKFTGASLYTSSWTRRQILWRIMVRRMSDE
jgi:hypothetical protein